MSLMSSLHSFVERIASRGAGGRGEVTLVRYLPRGERRGRLYVVGDLHAEYGSLMLALRALSFNPGVDRVLFVGDMHDRGRNSSACLELLRQPWVDSVLGNHELMLLDVVAEDGSLCTGRNGMYGSWMANGGEWVEEAPPMDRAEWRRLLLDRVPLYWIVERRDGRKVVVCHAEPDPVLLPDVLGLRNKPVPLGTLHASPTLWGRQTLRVAGDGGCSPQRKKQLLAPLEGVLYGVHGHSQLDLASWVNNRLFIDTGAVFGNLLTLVDVDQAAPGRSGGVQAWDVASEKLISYAATNLLF
jgi:serine/threonine protein phosphatase 1